ncbi:uncharacterized protein At2g39795, mitochondrial-like [Gastrolobium bilobum]|uniref:uncharacterized protein At2g39795, mitochondrial-like n=1 Tax=Gastrolobium bilobum TaxID=150636 RepID=UPI002AB1F19F|nr:uncharacterized protein At2g39795, mitochondrial-like [Gastrolobium bilobum]
MAMYTVLRRVSSTVWPLAARRVMGASSSRTLHSALSVGLLHRETTLIVPSLRFVNAFATKTSADDNLIQVLQSEIKCVHDDDHAQQVEIPDDFPFEIEDNPGERTIQLKRQYQGEIIKVQVDIPNVAPEENEDDDDGGDGGEKNDNESSIPLVVTIFKGNGVCLEFGVTAFPDEISIDSLSIKQPEDSEDQLIYEGPEFTDLDENLQKAFHKYLEIRGIKPSTTNFLQEYMINKDSKEYLMWLENLKYFIEK